MCRIEITITVYILFQSPRGLRFIKQSFKSVMNICSFAMYYLSKETLPHHIQNLHPEEIITNIFQHHAMFAGTLAGFNQPPAIIDCLSGRYFNGYMLTMVHRVNSHRRMQCPWCNNIYQINVIPVAKLFPRIFFSCVYIWVKTCWL